jgi:hypothetical protein
MAKRGGSIISRVHCWIMKAHTASGILYVHVHACVRACVLGMSDCHYFALYLQQIAAELYRLMLHIAWKCWKLMNTSY